MPTTAFPPTPPVPPRVGLLASARVLDDPGLRWDTAGIEVAVESCTGGGVADPCAVHTETIAARAPTVSVRPFEVWAGDRCSSWGFAEADYVGRASRLLASVESRHIASELWTGAQAIASGWPNRRLASPLSDVVNPSDGPLSPTNALACLERGLGSCASGARGMIHASRDVVTHWQGLGLLRAEGGLLLTALDTIVVADAGYDGSGPDGQAPSSGSVWAYGSDIVTVVRGPMAVVPGDFREALDRSANLVEFRAHRLAMAFWANCCHLAVEIDVVTCGIGGS